MRAAFLLFHAETERGKEWLNLHVPADATYFAGSLVVERRYALDLTRGMVQDGLTVRAA